MKLQWFVRKGIFFLPYSLMGWLILMIFAIVAVYLFINIDGRSHSVSDTLMNWVFNCLILAVMYSLVAVLTSKREA